MIKCQIYRDIDELSLSSGKSININFNKNIKMNKYRTHHCSELDLKI